MADSEAVDEMWMEQMQRPYRAPPLPDQTQRISPWLYPADSSSVHSPVSSELQ